MYAEVGLLKNTTKQLNTIKEDVSVLRAMGIRPNTLTTNAQC